MKCSMRVLAVLLVFSACFGAWPEGHPEGKAADIKAVLVTGGHGFDKRVVLPFFKGLEGIDVVQAQQRDHSELFEDIADWPYDVIVLYNMTREISAKRQKNFIELLDKGVGVVALHHSMGAFPYWSEYPKIIGVKYYSERYIKGGVEHAPCTYQHDVDFTMHVEDPDHPIMRGLSDFEVHDETYKGSDFEPDNHVLLTTDHPASDKFVAWVRTYRNAKVCTIQMGHGPQIFTHDAYRRLVTQAIRFCAGKGNAE